MNDYQKFQNLCDLITTEAIDGKIPISIAKDLDQTFEEFKASVPVKSLKGVSK